MFPRPTITEANEILCPLHSQKVEYFCQGSPFSSSQLWCSVCFQATLNPNYTKATFQSNPTLETLTVSLEGVSKPPDVENMKVKPPIDFTHCQLEHIIKDYRSRGYPPRNIVYIPDNQLLVACSLNGRVLLSQIGDSIEMLSEFSVEGTIRCAKYIPGETNKFLVIGVDKEIWFYTLNEKSAKFDQKIQCHCDVNDIEFLPDSQKIAVIGWSQFIRFWNINDLSFDRTIDASSHGANQPLCSAIYIKEKNAIALEDKDGICLVSLSADKDTEKDHIRYSNFMRKGYGMTYLPQSDNFMLRTIKSRAYIVNGKDMVAELEYTGNLASPELPGFRFMANEDESQILSNSNTKDLVVYQKTNSSVLYLTNLLTQSAGLEVLYDQYRFVVADQFSGTILVFRTNTTANYKYMAMNPFGTIKLRYDKPSHIVTSSAPVSSSPAGFNHFKSSLFSSKPLLSTNSTLLSTPIPSNISNNLTTLSKLAQPGTGRAQRSIVKKLQSASHPTTLTDKKTKAGKKTKPVFLKKKRASRTLAPAEPKRGRGRPKKETSKVSTQRKPQVRDVKARLQKAQRTKRTRTIQEIKKSRDKEVDDHEESKEIAETTFTRRITEDSDPQLRCTFDLKGKILTKADQDIIGEDIPRRSVNKKSNKSTSRSASTGRSPSKAAERAEKLKAAKARAKGRHEEKNYKGNSRAERADDRSRSRDKIVSIKKTGRRGSKTGN